MLNRRMSYLISSHIKTHSNRMAELSIGAIEFFLHVSVKYMNHLISGQRQVSLYSQINVPPGETQVNLVLLSALVLSVSGIRNGIHVKN